LLPGTGEASSASSAPLDFRFAVNNFGLRGSFGVFDGRFFPGLRLEARFLDLLLFAISAPRRRPYAV